MPIFRIAIFLLNSLATCALAQASNVTIATEEQQARDKDRHLILRTELVVEHQKLAKSQAAFAIGATADSAAEVHRHTENIKALQRELIAPGYKAEPRPPTRLAVKATHAATPRVLRSSAVGAFWNPYNRAPEPEASTDSPTTP
jgi:hypothetical protein